MSPQHRFASVAYTFLLGLLLMSLPQAAQAGDKLRKLKEDAVRIQQGTLLVAPILPDSFVLRKFDHPGGEAKRAAYLESIRISNMNLQQALQKHYRFSKMQVLPAVADYPAYFAALKQYDPAKFFLLQFGQAAQYATGRAVKASNFDKEFLGVYELDGQTRIYLNQGKLKLFPKLAYAESIAKTLNSSLLRYARPPKSKKSSAPALLAPSLTGKVALLPRENLYGNDSLTFRDNKYQTVVTTLPVKMYRAFGGIAMPGGSFVSPDTILDTAATRRALAIELAWGNTLEFEAVINVPVATKINIGIAGPQASLPGGGEQVIMPFKWNLDWIDRIYSLRSQQSWSLAEFRLAYPQYFPTK